MIDLLLLWIVGSLFVGALWIAVLWRLDREDD